VRYAKCKDHVLKRGGRESEWSKEHHFGFGESDKDEVLTPQVCPGGVKMPLIPATALRDMCGRKKTKHLHGSWRFCCNYTAYMILRT
jgi:hypothetical protein